MNTTEPLKDFARLFKHDEIGQILVTKELNDEVPDESKAYQLSFRFDFQGLDATISVSPLSEEGADGKLERMTLEQAYDFVKEATSGILD